MSIESISEKNQGMIDIFKKISDESHSGGGDDVHATVLDDIGRIQSSDKLIGLAVMNSSLNAMYKVLDTSVIIDRHAKRCISLNTLYTGELLTGLEELRLLIAALKERMKRL